MAPSSQGDRATRRARTVAHRSTQWPPEEDHARSTLYLQRRQALVHAPAETQRVRQLRERSREAGAVHQRGSFGYYRIRLEDQRFAAGTAGRARVPDRPLDNDLTLAGPIDVSSRSRTTGTDADFIVKVIDVYPRQPRTPDVPAAVATLTDEQLSGRQLVKGDVFRARWRNGYVTPSRSCRASRPRSTICFRTSSTPSRRGTA